MLKTLSFASKTTIFEAEIRFFESFFVQPIAQNRSFCVENEFLSSFENSDDFYGCFIETTRNEFRLKARGYTTYKSLNVHVPYPCIVSYAHN